MSQCYEGILQMKFKKSDKGMALVVVIAFTFIFTLIGFSMLSLAGTEIILTQNELNATKAFYAAEAGLAVLSTRLYNKQLESISETIVGDITYKVDFYFDQDPPFAIAKGKAGNQVRTIKAGLSFLAPPYERGIYAGNVFETKWALTLRGQGDPQAVGGGWSSREVGGRDMVNGNLFVNGDVVLFEESSVNPSPKPNPYQYAGDVAATGKADILDRASVSGAITEGAVPEIHPSLVDMTYSVNNTHNVGKIFAEAGVDWGHLPSSNELYNVMVKNPTDRAGECKTTVGDDYFLEPASVSNAGASSKDAKTPLHLGENRIYYVDGNVWIHSPRTYGFLVDGQVTVIATGDIHISDNVKYANTDSLLGLVALGRYDDSGRLIGGGNIYFGDPRFGTMYTVSALMFAANNFLYNIDSVTGGTAEPETGFTIYGNLNALNHVSIERDWYDPDSKGIARPAYFDATHKPDGKWIDLETGKLLSANEIMSLRHYQMILNYDDRVRTQDTQPPGLPRGKGTIFGGIRFWKELPASW